MNYKVGDTIKPKGSHLEANGGIIISIHNDVYSVKFKHLPPLVFREFTMQTCYEVCENPRSHASHPLTNIFKTI